MANLGEQVNENEHSTIKVYAGNYHETETFHGDLRVKIVYEDDTKEEKVFDVSIEPGEKVEVDSFFSVEQLQGFKFRFEPE